MKRVAIQLCIGIALLALTMDRGARAEEPGWQRIFQLPEGEGSLWTIWVDGDDWIAAGKGVIVRSQGSHVETTLQPGKYVVGVASTPAGIFAVGFGQLILRLDRTRWVQEHYVQPGPKETKRERYGSELLGVRLLGYEGPPVLTAYGTVRVLVRSSDQTWTEPSKDANYHLYMKALYGPNVLRPAGCASAGWIWIGDRGWFTCHDGRSFLNGPVSIKATGTVPRACDGVGDGIAPVGTSAYLLCDHKVWKSQDSHWHRLWSPDDVEGIAGSPHCLWIATSDSVWKNCREP